MAKKTSVGGWAYIWGGYLEAPIPFEEVLKKLVELGFDGIEMAAFPPHLEFTGRIKTVIIDPSFI